MDFCTKTANFVSSLNRNRVYMNIIEALNHGSLRDEGAQNPNYYEEDEHGK